VKLFNLFNLFGRTSSDVREVQSNTP